MVTFRNMGRMGNFFFQCATSISYALKYGMEFHIPTTTKNPTFAPIYLSHLSNQKFDNGLPETLINEQQHNYSEIPFQEEWRNTNITLNGYFQSEKYFKSHRDEILSLFGFEWKEIPNRVALHVRRGDYVNLPTRHPVVTNEYLFKAIEYFKNKGLNKFTVFSDGMDWCKKNITPEIYKDCEFEYSEGRASLENMVYGSCHQHQLISNSTFSWWQAWLNRSEDKIVVCPHRDNWFGTDNKYLSTEDIYPDEWIQIPFTHIYDLKQEEQLIYK